MSIATKNPTIKNSVLEFKSTTFSVPVLAIYETELGHIKSLLKEKISQAPEFFKNSPLVIDLQEINRQEEAFDLLPLIDFLRENKLIPIGLGGGNNKQNNLAIEQNIPLHTIRNSQANKVVTQNTEKNKKDLVINRRAAEPDTAIVESMLISQPIRSGQRIYAKGDLIIMSHVSAGAEVMAEGNIHVYGSLRGRALAGVQGNKKSRVFCSSLQAELISIAGHYKTSEELDKTEHNSPVQIYLQDQALIIKEL
ncbi:MAG: septum site-determining protein MinC [Methylococcales bacterium]|nr:septum site-determining protein MinC [Methylococcales bacterium]